MGRVGSGNEVTLRVCRIGNRVSSSRKGVQKGGPICPLSSLPVRKLDPSMLSHDQPLQTSRDTQSVSLGETYLPLVLLRIRGLPENIGGRCLEPGVPREDIRFMGDLIEWRLLRLPGRDEEPSPKVPPPLLLGTEEGAGLKDGMDDDEDANEAPCRVVLRELSGLVDRKDDDTMRPLCVGCWLLLSRPLLRGCGRR